MDGLIGKRSGKVLLKDFEDAEYLKKLEPVVQQLDEEVPDAGFDAKKLGSLVAQLMQFQEDTLGKESNFKRQPKLPAELLRDYAPRGALFVIAAKCDDIMAARDLKRIDWANPAKRKENIEILIGITKELEAEGLLPRPVVGLEPGLGAELAGKLAEAVRKMGGSVADSPDDARVTHRVVAPPMGVSDAGRGKPHQMRTLEIRGDMAQVHWTQLPDSYDEWVLTRHAPPLKPPPPPERTKPWRVYPRWIKDGELYNEWMHPQDYEAEPPLAQQAQQQAAAQQAAAAAQLAAQQAEAAAAAAPLPAALVAPLPGQHPPRPGAAGGAPGGPPQHAPLPGAGQASAPQQPAPQPAPPHPQQLQRPGPGPASGAAGGAAPMEVEHRRPPPPGAGLLGAPASMAMAGGGFAAQPHGPTPRPIAPGAAPAYQDASGAFASAFTAGAPAAAPAAAPLGPPAIAPLPGSQKNSGAARAAARAAAAAAANRDANAPAAKRARTEVFSRPDVIEGAGQRVAVNAVRQRVLDARKPAVDPASQVENVSQGQLPPLHDAPPRAPRAPTPPAVAARAAAPAAAPGPAPAPPPSSGPGPGAAPLKKTPHVVPACASWFDLGRVNPAHERAYLSEFFERPTPYRNAKTYNEMREALLAMYCEDPARRLTFTEARTRMQGDVTSLHRVWTLLDHWGIINFSAADTPWRLGGGGGQAAGGEDGPNSLTAALGPPMITRTLTRVDTPLGADSLYKFPRPSVADAAAAATSGGAAGTVHVSSGRGPRQQQLANRAAGEPPGSRPRVFCNAMPWVDCTDLRYRCTKYPDIDLCPEAFAEGRFPPGTTARDFVRLDATGRNSLGGAAAAAGAVGVTVGPPHGAPAAEGSWSQQETLLLLEGLEMFGDSWAEVADHVGNKSQVACILHFLQLPIEDAFLDDMEAGAGPRSGPVPAAAPLVAGGLRLQQQQAQAAAAARQAAAAAAAAAAATSAAGGRQPNPSPATGAGAPAPAPGVATTPARAGVAAVPAAAGGAAGTAAGWTLTNNIRDPDLLPFADHPNPIMAQLAFLSTMLGPRTAAAAAQRALEVLSEDDAVAAAAAAVAAATPQPAAAPKAAATAAAAAAPAAPGAVQDGAAAAAAAGAGGGPPDATGAAVGAGLGSGAVAGGGAGAATGGGDAMEVDPAPPKEGAATPAAAATAASTEAAAAGGNAAPAAPAAPAAAAEGGAGTAGEAAATAPEAGAAAPAGGPEAAEAGGSAASAPAAAAAAAADPAAAAAVAPAAADAAAPAPTPAPEAGSAAPPDAAAGTSAAASDAATAAAADAPAAAADAALEPAGPPPPPPPSAIPLAPARVKAAAAAGFAAAAARARVLADEAEQDMLELMAQIVEVQVAKVGLKVKYLEDVEQALQSERTQLETARRNLDGQRAQLRDARRARVVQQQGGGGGGGGGGGEQGLQLPLAGLPPAAAAALTAMGASGGLTQQQAAAAAQAATTAAAQMKQMQGGGGGT